MKRILNFILITILLAALVYIYARFMEPNFLKVHYEKINSNLLNEESGGLKILQFSDMHVSEYFNGKNISRVVDKINEEKPHIVVFTGDLIDEYNKYENKDNINEIWEALKKIKAPLGKYAVYGNHDYGGGAERIYKEIMENSDFILLTNEKVTLNAYNINIIGMDDSIFGDVEKEKIIGLMDEDKYNIILSHEPDIIDDYLEHSVDLFLAGHSHGGQVNIPFVDSLPAMGEKYTRGIYNFSNYRQTVLYVNIGLGTSQIPLRFMASPELAVFILER